MCVNAVRFSPNGECLATGGDDGYVIVWYRTTCPLDPSIAASTSWDDVTSVKQLQRVIMRGKLSEICDLAWTSDSKYVITGSVDGTIGVWDVCNAKLCQQTKDHKGFVQGVAADPLGEYVTTQCSSRTVRVHRAEASKKGRTTLRAVDTIRARAVGWEPVASMGNKEVGNKEVAAEDAKEAAGDETGAVAGDGASSDAAAAADADAADAAAAAAEKPTIKTMSSHALFLDNMSTTTFFRRPTWTIDGSLLIAPTGQFKAKANDKYQNTTYLFARGEWNR
jgi:chromatin assembly factor 1 subunit B